MGLFKSKSAIDPNSEHRDWELVSSLAQDVLKEQKRARRWGIFFKLLTFAYITVIIVSLVSFLVANNILSPWLYCIFP